MGKNDRPVWTARDLEFHSCGPDCCEKRPSGFFTIPKGTKGLLVRPRKAEKARLMFLREAGERYFLVELLGVRRYLLRSDLLGEDAHNQERKKSKSRLAKLAQRGRK